MVMRFRFGAGVKAERFGVVFDTKPTLWIFSEPVEIARNVFGSFLTRSPRPVNLASENAGQHADLLPQRAHILKVDPKVEIMHFENDKLTYKW